MKRIITCLLMVLMTLGANAKVDVDFSSRFTASTPGGLALLFFSMLEITISDTHNI